MKISKQHMMNRPRSIEIQGLRGFQEIQRLEFALPNGAEGSGLTMLVGPNNGGKSTVIEALRVFGQGGGKALSIPSGKRNKAAGDAVTISLTLERGHKKQFRTREAGTSECEFSVYSDFPELNIYALPSRRVFAQFFSASAVPRVAYIQHQRSAIERQAGVTGFEDRLLNAQKHRQEFNAVLSKIIDPVPKWTIDRDDRGDFFVKIATGDHFHNSEGIGDGLPRKKLRSTAFSIWISRSRHVIVLM